MTDSTTRSATGAPSDALDHAVRTLVFSRAAETARVPQAPEVARELSAPQADVEEALRRLAAGRALILVPGSATIWAANPFSAVPTAFRVRPAGSQHTYWGVCIWDALGVLAALKADGTVTTQCGCSACGQELTLTVNGGELDATDVTRPSATASPLVHFGVPASRWWENIVFT